MRQRNCNNSKLSIFESEPMLMNWINPKCVLTAKQNLANEFLILTNGLRHPVVKYMDRQQFSWDIEWRNSRL